MRTKVYEAPLRLHTAMERADCEPLFRQTNRALEQIAPGPSPVYAVHRLEPAHKTGNQDGAMAPAVRIAEVSPRLVARENAWFHANGALVAEIDEARLLLVLAPQERHAAAAQTGIERLRHAQDKGHGHRRVAGIPALLDDAQTCLHRLLMGRRYREHARLLRRLMCRRPQRNFPGMRHAPHAPGLVAMERRYFLG